MSRCGKHPDWGVESCLICLEESDASELATLRARVVKLEPIVDLAAKWYLEGGMGIAKIEAELALENALHTYLELT
jgi:hypothetical protein